MGVRSWLADLFDRWGGDADVDAGPSVNPATGLPMLDRAVDVAGNPYGTDLHRHDDAVVTSASWADDHHHGSVSPIDDDWNSAPWPDHACPTSSGGGYDPSRDW